MGEINGPKININQLSFNSTQKQASDDSAENVGTEGAKITDFGDPKAEALGRSMLIKNTDDINHDLKALLENPQIAENSDKMFETAYAAAETAGIKNPYEEAASFSTGSV